MEARQADVLPHGPGWQFESKWDGFRCLVFRSRERIELRAKSGKSLARFFPEAAAMAGALEASPFALDGELVAVVDGVLSFEALQMRLHPAQSRIERLARETPAALILFDYLAGPEGSLLAAPLARRRQALEGSSRRTPILI